MSLELPYTSPLTFFFFNDTATTEIYTLSLHDALPISTWKAGLAAPLAKTWTRSGTPVLPSMAMRTEPIVERASLGTRTDRKSTRLNSSHQIISYAVFCLKKKKYNINIIINPHRQW